MKKNTTVYLDEDVVAKFDVIADRTGTNRSKFVNVKMKEFIKEHERLEKVRRQSQEDYND